MMTQPYECPDCHRPKATSVAEVAKGDCPKWWAIRDPMAEHDCKVHAEKAAKDALWAHCQKFIKSQQITCAETIGQCDRVIVNAYDFIEGVCDIVGYEKDEAE